ncbi:MAG: hypothetical protein GX297_07055 [Treponema sp.]|jgi:hypothetical protein|nr:hypothetical protein [Treponema sp.]
MNGVRKEKLCLEKRSLIEMEIVAFAGVSKSTWHKWQTQKGAETKHNHETPRMNQYTPEEKQIVVKYILEFAQVWTKPGLGKLGAVS